MWILNIPPSLFRCRHSFVKQGLWLVPTDLICQNFSTEKTSSGFFDWHENKNIRMLIALIFYSQIVLKCLGLIFRLEDLGEVLPQCKPARFLLVCIFQLISSWFNDLDDRHQQMSWIVKLVKGQLHSTSVRINVTHSTLILSSHDKVMTNISLSYVSGTVVHNLWG